MEDKSSRYPSRDLQQEERTKYQPPRIEQHSFFPNRENPNANSAMDLLALDYLGAVGDPISGSSYWEIAQQQSDTSRFNLLYLQRTCGHNLPGVHYS